MRRMLGKTGNNYGQEEKIIKAAIDGSFAAKAGDSSEVNRF